MRPIVLLLALIATAANAQSQDVVARVSAATCRVTVNEPGGMSGGSGVLIGPRLVITAYHVLRNTQGSTARCDFGQGNIPVVGWLKNKNADQFLLELRSDPAGIAPVQIATAAPELGQQIFGVGYGMGNFGIWKARLAGYASKVPYGNETAIYDGDYTVSGDSGGGAFTLAGKYVGTMWGSAEDRSDISCVRFAETRSFLDRTGMLARIQQGQAFQAKPYMAPGGRLPVPGGTTLAGTPAACPPGTSCPPAAPSGLPDYPPQRCDPCVIPQEHVNQAVSIYLDQHPPPAGRDGNDGRDGDPGSPGSVGEIGPAGEVDYQLVGKIVSKTITEYLAANPPPAGETGPPGEVDYELVREIIREELANLPPAYLQPSYYDATGQLRAEGSPIELTLGQQSLLPPVALEVIGVTGRRSTSQGPLGGTMRVKMADIE